jgi:hypothetical protein
MEWIMTFHSVGNFIIPTDLNSMIFQRGRAKNHQPDDHTMDNHHTINGKINYKWPFSIAMLNYQRVMIMGTHNGDLVGILE